MFDNHKAVEAVFGESCRSGRRHYVKLDARECLDAETILIVASPGGSATVTDEMCVAYVDADA